MATKTAKAQKQVEIIARAQFKSDPRKVCYQVKSSNGKDTYWTCLFDGKATSCGCPATKPCYHMTQVQQIEAERKTRQAAEQAENEVVQVEWQKRIGLYASDGEAARRQAYCNMFNPCGL